MRVVIAPDKFKGTATASALCEAIADVVTLNGHQAEAFAMADGGEGTLEALGGANRVSVVTGPAGERVEASWRCTDDVAVIEMAEAAGLTLAGGAAANDPIAATTFGVGQLIAEAIDSGVSRIIVGVGGSATTDGGRGALAAIRDAGVDPSATEIIVGCDVLTPFIDAAEVFGPQKGATPDDITVLTGRLEKMADEHTDIGLRSLPRSGAAGGLAGGLATIGANLIDGFSVVASAIGLESSIATADLVITGEGQVDAESFKGKVVGGVLSIAQTHDVPVFVIAGRITPPAHVRLAENGIVSAVDLRESFGEASAMGSTLECVKLATTQLL